MLHLLQKTQVKKLVNKIKNLTPVEASASLHVIGLICLIVMLGFSGSQLNKDDKASKQVSFKFSVEAVKKKDIIIETKPVEQIPTEIVIAKSNNKVADVKDASKPTSLVAKPPAKVISNNKTAAKKAPKPELVKEKVDSSKSLVKAEKKDVKKVEIKNKPKVDETSETDEGLDKFLNDLSSDDNNKDFNYGYSSENGDEDTEEVVILRTHIKNCISYYYDDSADLFNNLIVKIRIVTGNDHLLQSFSIVGANRKLEQGTVSSLLSEMKKAFLRENCRNLPISDNLLGKEKEFYVTLDLSER